MNAKVTENLVDVLAEMVDREPGSISMETRFFEDMGFDSTSILVLLMHIENNLGVQFDPDLLEPDDLETVGALVDFINRQPER
ncbi:acyl carrier protein [Plantactinospora sp. KLBMP9567]|uniref:acyl carrier protein n=1 Tax=Plantactinospora sp. KLBMP9567 TaxID=3085900 RepID=UPI0029812204|nr:acyl carrier protein [Plantactinospora sp. KLBMP9567]MDW5329526.1 acyl carrier protein [Plantactinospora sp. KLBMP9567]